MDRINRQELLYMAAPFAAAGGWMLTASAILSTGTGASFTPLLWLDAVQWGWFLSNWWITAWIIVSALLPTALLAILALAGWRFWRTRGRTMLRARRDGRVRPIERGPTDNHGHSQWRSLEDTKKRFPGPHPLWGGLVVGEAYRVDLDRRVRGIPFNPDDKATWGLGGRAPLLIDPCTHGGHSAVFAGTGSGKSATAKTQILHWRGSSVVFDPSIELGPELDGALKRQRKKVFHIGIPDPSLPIQMTGLNVLAWLDTSHPEIDAHLRSTVVRIYDEDRAATAHNEDEFFATMGRALVTCILADLVYSDPNKVEISLATFAKGMSMPEDDMLDLIEEIYNTSRSAMARHYAGSLMGSRAKETFSSIRLTAVKGIEWLFSPIYADLVSVPTENFDPQALLLGNCTVFININLRTLESTPAIARVLIGSLLNTVFMANGYVRGWILFLIDEAFKAGADKGLETARDMGRHYKVVLHLLYQSVGQMRQVWGEDGMRAWLDNLSWVGYSGIRAAGAGNDLSRDLGGYGVLAYSEGDQRGRHKPFGFAMGSISKGTNQNVHEIAHPLITGAQMQQDFGDDEILIVPASGMPIRCGKALYYRRPEIIAQIGNDQHALSSMSA